MSARPSQAISLTQTSGGARKPIRRKRIFVLGATGTVGRSATQALLARGHDVVCFVRPQSQDATRAFDAEIRLGDALDPSSLSADGFRGERFDVVVSAMASRTGAPRDAWRVDCDAHRSALAAAKDAGVEHFILVSAICVQKPQLAFQHAKLAFEKDLRASGLGFSIVRPTALFKSLSGQVDRVRRGKPFMMFGDGELTACKPISDRDLGGYIADCVDDPARRNAVLPIGGPGPALTPRAQGEMLFAAAGRRPAFKSVPPSLLNAAAGVLGASARIIPPLRDKAALARIGHYYATQSMLVIDPETGAYSDALTPSTGADTLGDHYRQLLRGDRQNERREHAVF